MEQEILIVNPELKAKIWGRLNQEVKNCVKEAAQKDDPQTTLRSVSAVHAVIQNSFAELGIKDPEDLWNLVLTSLADEYWCEIQNQCVDDHENGE